MWKKRLLLSFSILQERCTDRKSTRLNSSHLGISYAVFCLKKKKRQSNLTTMSSGQSVQRPWRMLCLRSCCWSWLVHSPSAVLDSYTPPTFFFFFFLLMGRPPSSPLFPSRTFFR